MKTANLDRWLANYRLWLDDCLIQFNERYPPHLHGGEKRLYHQDNVPKDAPPGDLVEFGEDGSAYPHGAGGTNWIPNAVTAWDKSPHFLD